MKKRILGLLLALCLVVGLLPVAALADEPGGGTPAPAAQQNLYLTYQPNGKWSNTSHASKAQTDTIAPGPDATYYVASKIDAANPDSAYLVKVTDGSVPTDNYVKIEYPVGGTPTITLHGLKMNNQVGICFGDGVRNYAYARDNLSKCASTLPYKVVLEGENEILVTPYVNSCRWGVLNFLTTGDVTITGTGSLKATGAANGDRRTGVPAAYWASEFMTYGNLTIENVKIDFAFTEYHNTANAFASYGGDIVVKNAEISVDAKDFPDNQTESGMGGNMGASAFAAMKNAAGNGGNVIFENSKITAVGAPSSSVKSTGVCFVDTEGTCTIKNSAVELTVEYPDEGQKTTARCFNKAPILELDTTYGVICSIKMVKDKSGTYKNSYRIPDAPIAYDGNDAEIVEALRYFKCGVGVTVPTGGTDSDSGSGTGTGTGTNGSPATGDMNVALIAVIAMFAAVSMAGVTVIRKKNA